MNDSLNIYLFQLYVIIDILKKNKKTCCIYLNMSIFFSDIYKIIVTVEEIYLIKNNLDNKLKQTFECRTLF
jgi:hypothetical protein